MKKRIKSIICITAWVLIAVMLAISCYQVYKHFSEDQEQTEQFDKLATLVETLPPTMPDEPSDTLAPIKTAIETYAELFERNSDMVGWIKIDGTTINYPVMQTPDRPSYYLKHNFDKEYSNFGVPFVSEACDLESSENLVIFGHHIKGGKMFGALESYKSKDFYLSHPIIHFDTQSGFGEYEIIAVFRTTPGRFRYDEFINAADKTAFDEFVNMSL